jgi:hypothetical protein
VSFLSPALLALAAAAAVPLLLHLMRRRIARRIEFPAARYLLRAERENSRRMRLRNLLLMLLRVAAVLLLTAAAARPVGRLAVAGHAPTAVAIVLDNTLSTAAVVDGQVELARTFIDLVLSPSGQAVLAERGFMAAGGTTPR